jgi:hypothetical protein
LVLFSEPFPERLASRFAKRATMTIKKFTKNLFGFQTPDVEVDFESVEKEQK